MLLCNHADENKSYQTQTPNTKQTNRSTLRNAA